MHKKNDWESTSGAAFWSVKTEDLLTGLQSSELGLTQAAAAQRLSRTRQLTSHRRSTWVLLRDQFKNPIILLLFGTAILSFSLIEDRTNGWIIIFILLVSGLLGFWQELSAADAVAKLLGMIETKAVVIRDGQEREIALEFVVPGDVVRLSAGEVIPGDCRLLMARELFLNEAAMTGESFPVEKIPTVLAEETLLSQRVNCLYLGTHVISGIGTAVVVGTGRDTEFGKISERLEQKTPETGFERGLRHFGQLLIKIVLVITFVVFAVKVAPWPPNNLFGLRQRPVTDSLLVALALAVGMTPQLLPAITSVVLAAGAKAMAKHQVIVKHLLSIENLGSMTVLCSDKTGTLTEGFIRLRETVDAAGHHSDRVARFAYLNAFFQAGFSNAIDRAIRDGCHFETDGIEKLDEVPYDFIRKRLSVGIALEGHKVLVTKGALANVLEVCSHVEFETGERVELALEMDAIQRRFAALSSDGLRVLGVAIRTVDSELIDKNDENKMTFLGLLVFSDPPKADAKETLEQRRQLGIRLKVITGDNRAVAIFTTGRTAWLRSSAKSLTSDCLDHHAAIWNGNGIGQTPVFSYLPSTLTEFTVIGRSCVHYISEVVVLAEPRDFQAVGFSGRRPILSVTNDGKRNVQDNRVAFPV